MFFSKFESEEFAVVSGEIRRGSKISITISPIRYNVIGHRYSMPADVLHAVELVMIDNRR